MTTTTPARVALGLAALAAERVRANAAGGDVLATAVGLVEETGQAVRSAAGMVAAPPKRAAAIAVHRAARLPGASLVRRPALRAGDRVREGVAAARERGRHTMAVSRAEGATVVQSAIDDGLRWLVPRILDRSLPEVRTRLLPVVVEQLTTDARLREFLTEQTRVLLDSATDRLGGKTTALAR